MEPLCICGHGLSYHQWADSQKANCDHCACAKYTAREDGQRHPKWVPVSPGTVIPAGQPYMIERVSTIDGSAPPSGGDGTAATFVDSSWRPPLVLPTEPTWGIAVHRLTGAVLAKCRLDGDEFWLTGTDPNLRWSYRAHNVIDFIPLTEEQVQRIEATR